MAEGEVRNWCVELLTVRRAIVKERILKAIGLPKSPVLPRGPWDVIEASPLDQGLLAGHECFFTAFDRTES
jgi:hypothetical protein